MAGGLFAYQLYYAKRRDIFDEFARENLRTTDSICLKIACGVLVLAAVLFTVIDKRGM